MDRRTFNKSLAGLATTLSLPFAVPKAATATAAVATVNPVIPAVGHYGFTSMSLTTSFNLEPTFEYSQIGLTRFLGVSEYPPPEDPVIEFSVSFFLDSEKKVERTVYFEGNNKEFVELTKINKKESQSQSQMINDLNVDSKYIQCYEAQDIKVYHPDTKKQVFVSQIEKDQLYTIHVDISSDDNPSCRVILTDFKAIDFQDYNEDENNFQSQER